MKKHIFLLITNLLAFVSLAGQSLSGIPFTERIQGRRIMRCIEDLDGYLWIGTDKGLFRYNGSVYFPYYADNPESLTSDFIVSLCADTNQRIWVGTDNGICLIQNGKVVRQSEPGSDYAFSLFNLNDSTLLYSSQDALFRYDKKSGKSSIVLQGNNYSAPRYLKIVDGKLWIISGFNEESTLAIYTLDFRKTRDIPILRTGTVTGIASKGDTVFVGTSRGISCFLSDGKPIPVPGELQNLKDQEISFCSDNPHFNSILFGQRNEGIWLYRPGQALTKTNTEQTLPSSFYRVIPARQALVLSEWEKDLTFLYGPSGTLRIPGIGWGEVLTNILPGDSPDQGLLVTTGGLYTLDVHSMECRPLPLSFSLHAGQGIRSSLRSATGDIVLMDRQGQLIRLTKAEDRWSVSSRQRTTFPDGWIWEDYEGHICTVHQNVMFWIGVDGQSGTSPLDMELEGTPYKSPDGRLYIIGSQGIFQLDFGHRFNRLPFEVPFASCMLQSADGDLFIGSATNGLYQYHPADKTLTHYGSEEGLPERTVSNLAQDSEGNIWISTRHFIAKLDKSDHRLTVKEFSGTFPLSYSKLCVLPLPESSEGEVIVFGGDQSVSVVKTKNGHTPPSSIPLSLDAFLVNNRLRDIPDSTQVVVLKHNENLLTFYYSGMDFLNSGQLNYSYFLDGFDNNWVSAGRNIRATYSNLPTGNYTFRVRVALQDGTTSCKEIAFPFRIKPSPWLSWPAIMLYTLLALALIGLLLRYYWLYQKTRERALLAEADRALAESEHLIRQPEPQGESLEKPAEKQLTSKEKDFIVKMNLLVEENLSEESFNATVLAERIGMSYTRFYLKVKELLEMTPQEYLTDRRLSHARELLESGDYNVSEVCYQVGFSSLPGFSRSFKKRFGIPPSEAVKTK